MLTVGIYGGSFAPIHLGHIAVARGVLAQGLADQVWLMVSRRNPLKERNNLFTDPERLDMARLAVGADPRLKVSDLELHMPEPSYTYLTMRRLRHDFPELRFRLIVGADSLATLPQWAHPQELIADYGLIVYPRPGTGQIPLPDGAVMMHDVPLSGISSTEVRALLRSGASEETIAAMTGSPVARYLKRLRPTPDKQP